MAIEYTEITRRAPPPHRSYIVMFRDDYDSELGMPGKYHIAQRAFIKKEDALQYAASVNPSRQPVLLQCITAEFIRK